jgi:hypothetical protein
LPAATLNPRCLAQQHQCIELRKKIVEGIEPGEDAASSPKKNREENNMLRNRLSRNLT